jgi:hypothetical protein
MVLHRSIDAMVTTDSMRDFAAHCLVWARRSRNPSERQIILDAAHSWAMIAAAIDRLADEGRSDRPLDFRQKLN